MIDKETVQKMIEKASTLELELFWVPKIMRNQTSEELDARQTIEHNNVGLNGVDARFMSSVYEQIIKGKHMSMKQESAVKKTLYKYWKQYIVG